MLATLLPAPLLLVAAPAALVLINLAGLAAAVAMWATVYQSAELVTARRLQAEAINAERRRMAAAEQRRQAAQERMWQTEQARRLREEARLAQLRPRPRLLRGPHDGEDVAAEWMRYWRFLDARTTGRGADGGIDVFSERGVAQVKMEAKPTGRPSLQRLHGAATARGKRALFFSLAGYSQLAKEWALEIGMPLFTFDLQGEPTPANRPAQELQRQAEEQIRAEAHLVGGG